MIDRLTHHAAIVSIVGESFRKRECLGRSCLSAAILLVAMMWWGVVIESVEAVVDDRRADVK